MNVMVDQNTCIGCGLCCGMCEAVFQMNDEGKAEACQPANGENKDQVQGAIDACPVAAIRWEE